MSARLFNFKFSKAEDSVSDKPEEKYYGDILNGMNDLMSAFDMSEKACLARTKEIFKRPVFDTEEEVCIGYDSRGNMITKKIRAYEPHKGNLSIACDAMGGRAQEEGIETSTMSSPVNRDVINKTIWKAFEYESYIGWSACAILAQNPIIHLACSIPTEDAISSDYDFSFADHDDADLDNDGRTTKDMLSALKRATKSMGIDKVCMKFAYNKRVFGSGIAFPIIYYRGKPLDMSKPFNIDMFGSTPEKRAQFDYRGFKVVDPYWLVPVFDEESRINPVSERFMQPTWYRISNGALIHWSWFCKTDNAEVADILKPTYYYMGMPLTQMIYRRVWCAEKTANEAPQLALSKRLLVVDDNIQQLFKNKKKLFDLMSVLTQCRNNWGVFFKRPNAQVQQIDTALNHFEETVFSQYQLVASISQMPASKLLQTPPKGFNTTGEFEWKTYAQLLLTIQNNDYKPLIEKHCRIMLALQGSNHIINVSFNAVDAPSAKEESEIEKNKADARVAYVTNGILTPEEVRENMRNDIKGGFSSISQVNLKLVQQQSGEINMPNGENNTPDGDKSEK